MKKKFFLASVLAAALSFSCSDDIVDKGDVNGGKGEVGYVKVTVNLPTVSGNSVKAGNGNDVFDDGLADEYKVNNIILAFFQGASETEATCLEAHSLTSLAGTEAGGNVTVKYPSGVIEITKPKGNDKVYALAIVNNGGYFSVEGNKLKFNGKDFSGNLLALNDVAQTVDLDKMAKVGTDANFLMTNAPASNQPGKQESDSKEGHQVTTLVSLTIYSTQAAAESDAANANQIYVERAVAKVTTSVKNGTDNTLTISNPGSTYDGATVKFEGWRLNLTNKEYYPIRNVSAWSTWDGYYADAEVNRFFGYAPNPYRVYWAIDPNYGSTNDDDLNRFTAADAPESWNNMSANEYCAENTTMATEMKANNLTSILLQATFKLKDGKDDDNLFILGNNSAIYSENDFVQFATAQLTGANALGAGESLKISSNPTGGLTVKDSQTLKSLIEVQGNEGGLTEDQAKAILEASDGTIRFYKGGVMYYYTSLIKHFGDDPTKYEGDKNNPAYEEEKHLGRYGVVRNNWYEININSVSGPGEPDIPEVPEEPADKEHSYINAQVNILSWAKRTQDVDL